MNSADAATNAARDLIHAIQNPHPAGPHYSLGDPQVTAMKQLAGIFQQALPKPTGIAAPRVEPKDKIAAMTIKQTIPETPHQN